MPYHHVSFFFRHHDTGWTEKYICDAVSFSAAQGLALTLLQKRNALSAPVVTVQAVRIGVVGERRNAGNMDIPVADRNGSYVPAVASEGFPNIASDALLLEFGANAPRYKARKFLRGMPDPIFKNGAFDPPADWLTAFSGAAGYTATLLADPWWMQNKPPPPLGGWVYNRIMSVKVIRPTIRRTGRPFGLPVGRR